MYTLRKKQVLSSDWKYEHIFGILREGLKYPMNIYETSE
jgi:hypothetical protein